MATITPRPDTAKVIEGRADVGSRELSELVMAAREFRAWRLKDAFEGEVPPSAMLDARARRALESLARGLLLGGRGIMRVTRVARTIADIAEHELVGEEDVVEAMAFRSRMRG